MEPLRSEKFVCCCSGRDSCMLPSRCMLPSLHPVPSSKLPPFCLPVSPVTRAARCKPCPVALVPILGCSRPPARNLDLVRSAMSGSIMTEDFFNENKTVLTFFGHVELSRKKRSTGSPRRFRSCLDERGHAPWESVHFPYLQPCPRTHGEIRGRNAPGRRARDSYTRRK